MKPSTTTIDWFRFRTRAEPGAVLDALRPLYGTLGDAVHFGTHGRGTLGFKYSLPVLLADVPLGRLDFGGDSQRGWIRADITGKGCGFVQDWTEAEGIEDLEDAQLRRADIALTTWHGEITHDRVVQAHTAGKFTTGGRPPNLRTIVNSDTTAGRTCYIGQRDADKFLRAYEKGWELLAGSRMLAASIPGSIRIEGSPPEDIYRVELELKAQSMDIPWHTIQRRDEYFSGAYPFCAEILPGIEPDILQRHPKKAAQRELQAALATLRTQWGRTLFTALTAYGGDIGAVWERIVGTEHNPHLLEAGVLLFDPDE